MKLFIVFTIINILQIDLKGFDILVCEGGGADAYTYVNNMTGVTEKNDNNKSNYNKI